MGASFSSSSSGKCRYDFFVSYYGPDVHRTFLSHLRKELSHNRMIMFDDQEIERGQNMTTELIQAIRESRVSIVVLSKNYASSRWCMDELMEILKCKKDIGQIVMTVFYGVDPSDVRNQKGEFGDIFFGTRVYKTEEEMRVWSQALKDVGSIDGEHFLNRDKEADLNQQISQAVSRRLNATVSQSRDIEKGLVLCELSSSNKRKSKYLGFTVLAFVVINLLVEIASAVADQLSSIRKPYLARISLAMSILSVVLSILDLTYKVRAHKARFRCKWPIPWFYYPLRGYRRIFGSVPETVLLFCVVGGLVVSTINYSFIEKGKDGPIKISIWPLFFASGMVASKLMENPVISN